MKCGRCGAETVKRTNRRTGAEFHGCSTFPKCSWSHNPPRHEIVGSLEGQRILNEDGLDGGIYAAFEDEPDPGGDW